MTHKNSPRFNIKIEKDMASQLNALLSRQQINALTEYGIKSPEHFIALLCHRELDLGISNLLGVDRTGLDIILDVLGVHENQSDEDIEERINTGFVPKENV